jgi:hypothetical protein
VGSQTVRPVDISFGSSTALSLVGGTAATVLSDDSDTSYLAVSDLDDVNGRGATVTFEAFDLPSGLLTDLQMRARYQQVSGDSQGRPSLDLDAFFIGLTLSTNAVAGGPVVDEAGPFLNGGSPSNFEGIYYTPGDPTPVVWTLGLNFVGAGACAFRIYEMALTAIWDEATTVATAAATRGWPRDDALGLGSANRIHPPPRSGRIVGGHQ